MLSETPDWWPPQVGDQIRMYHLVDRGPIARLCHVLAAFFHDGKHHVVVGFYGVHKQRWHYEVMNQLEAGWKYWPDGQECPDAGLAANLREARTKRQDDDD